MDDIGIILHLDHVIPLAFFDLTGLEQQKKAMNWKNIQPLEAKRNISKGAKVNHWLTVCQDVKARYFRRQLKG